MESSSHHTVAQKLTVLALADELGNVSEACRRYGISRTTFYKYRRRFERDGHEGLRDLPPVPLSHPMKTCDRDEERVLAFSTAHPGWGCDRIAEALAEHDVVLSGPTVQRILNEHDRCTRHDRWLQLEEHLHITGDAPSNDQRAFLEQHNPRWRDHAFAAARPGEFLSQDVFCAGRLGDGRKLYIHAFVDFYSCYGFARIATSREAQVTAAILNHDVASFFDRHGLPTGCVLAASRSDGHPPRERGDDSRISRIYRAVRTAFARTVPTATPPVRPSPTDGFARCFREAVEATYPEHVFEHRAGGRDTLEAHHAALARWLSAYNGGRSLPVFPNFGASPSERLSAYLASVSGEG